jgi:integrase
MKSGRPFVVPISWLMHEILNEAKKLRRGPDALVFPSPSKPDRILSENTMTKLAQRLYPDATVHGLRSSFRDWAEINTPVSREVKEAAMAHINADKVEAAYLRYEYMDEREQLMEAWGFFLKYQSFQRWSPKSGHGATLDPRRMKDGSSGRETETV